MSRRKSAGAPVTPDAPDSPRYLTSGQVSRLLGVSHRSVVRWADDGALPVAKTTVGGHRRFTREAVDAFAASLERPQDGS